MKYLVTAYLGMNPWTDWKTKEIDSRYTIIFVLFVCALKIYKKEPLYWSGIVPGILLYAVSLWKKSNVGNGDGIVIAAVGWALGIEKIWNILVSGFLFACAAGIFVWFKERKKETEIPFVPFLMAGYIVEEYGKWFV